MKKILILAIMATALLTTSDAKPKAGRFGVFYSSLSPYGEWVDVNFGYAWRPYHVGREWRPYILGRWIWTDFGWYWASTEPFGWATYHYGRWQYDEYYGWVWIPDDVWGPAWVEWRYDDDYVGWSPLPTYAVFSVRFGISFTKNWNAPYHHWNFVPCRNFTSNSVVDYVQSVEHTRRLFGRTRHVLDIRTEGDRIVNRGLDVRHIERRGNLRVNKVDIVQGDIGRGDRIVRDANRERIEVYRPRVATPGNDDRRSGREIEKRRSDRGNRPSVNPERPKPSNITPESEADVRLKRNRDADQRFELPKHDDRDATRQERKYEPSERKRLEGGRDGTPRDGNKATEVRERTKVDREPAPAERRKRGNRP